MLNQATRILLWCRQMKSPNKKWDSFTASKPAFRLSLRTWLWLHNCTGSLMKRGSRIRTRQNRTTKLPGEIKETRRSTRATTAWRLIGGTIMVILQNICSHLRWLDMSAERGTQMGNWRRRCTSNRLRRINQWIRFLFKWTKCKSRSKQRKKPSWASIYKHSSKIFKLKLWVLLKIWLRLKWVRLRNRIKSFSGISKGKWLSKSSNTNHNSCPASNWNSQAKKSKLLTKSIRSTYLICRSSIT